MSAVLRSCLRSLSMGCLMLAASSLFSVGASQPVPARGADNQPPRAVILGGGHFECPPSSRIVTLDGSGSSDPEGGALTYEWLEWAGLPFEELLGTGPAIQVYVDIVREPGHLITLRVTDPEGTTGSAQVSVAVDDTTPPRMTCPDAITVECAGPVTHVELSGFSAWDSCFRIGAWERQESPMTEWFGTNNFVHGTTLVTLTAYPDGGPPGSCTIPVTVQDTTPPSLSVSVSPSILRPANHEMVPVVAQVTSSDVCGTMDVILADLTSSEPDDAPGRTDGSTTEDIQGADIGTADVQFELRAERDTSGPGRTYAITYEAIDVGGLHASRTVFVRVPRTGKRLLPLPEE